MITLCIKISIMSILDKTARLAALLAVGGPPNALASPIAYGGAGPIATLTAQDGQSNCWRHSAGLTAPLPLESWGVIPSAPTQTPTTLALGEEDGVQYAPPPSRGGYDVTTLALGEEG